MTASWRALLILAFCALGCRHAGGRSPEPPTDGSGPVGGAVAVESDAQAAVEADPGSHPVLDVEPAVPDDALVDVATLIPTIHLDIRYATADNFTRTKVYKEARCLLRHGVAQRLKEAQAALRARGYGLKVWDCYRPFSVQEAFWKLVPDPRYVAEPVRDSGRLVRGSKHNRGAAVEVTLVDLNGGALALPTDSDDFSPKAHLDYAGATTEQKRHRDILSSAMTAAGFEPMATEWWHFDGPGWRGYDLSDEPFSPAPP
jgi:beta-N-acetylhexosaminidase/D-alanyl-D-alanine dipeptidase